MAIFPYSVNSWHFCRIHVGFQFLLGCSFRGCCRRSLDNGNWWLIPDDHWSTDLLFSLAEGILGMSNVISQWGVEVVKGLLGWVDWSIVEVEVPLVLLNLLRSSETLNGGIHVWVSTEVWHKVVHWVSLWSSWPFVLSASSGGANWIR